MLKPENIVSLFSSVALLNVMAYYKDKQAPSQKSTENALQETANSYASGFVLESEEDRLLKDSLRPPIEKLQLFTRMIRRNAMLKRSQSK